jgi:general secretion pathway protein D
LRADLLKAAALVLVVASLAACGAGKAFKLADQAARVGDWDTAVRHYEQAVEADPNSAEYKIALERARLAASRDHLTKANEFEAKGDIEGAITEYRRVTDFDPANRRAAAKVSALEQTLRDRIEAARPKPQIEQMKERVRQAASETKLDPTSRKPLDMKFAAGLPVKQILEFLAGASGINVLFEGTFNESTAISKSAIDLGGVTLEQALQLVMTSNTLFYKVMNSKTILVIPDQGTNRSKYEDQVIKTIPLSHADPKELLGILNTILGTQVAQGTSRPLMQINPTANSITIRGSASMVAIAERVIENNDKPRAEVVIDIEILEVNRTRVKQYGLSLSNYQIGLGFSPDAPPGGGTASGGTTGGAAGGTATVATTGFTNLNTLVHGVSTTDFYVALPSAVIKFLESDSKTKLVAKPSLRGAEGTKLTANLGDEIPVPSTSFMPLVAGGTAMNPMTSFTYKQVGVNVAVTPRVTYDGDIILDLEVESSTKGSDVNIGGQNLPAFGSRKVVTRMRLRDGESNLLAGLLRDDERKSLTGFPGGIHVPVIKQLFSANDEQISQTDIVMLLTPHIIRTQALTERNLQEIYIGTAQNPVLGGTPPMIGQPTEPDRVEAFPAGVAPPVAAPITTQPYGTQGAALVGGAPLGRPTAAGTPVVPPGASPIPGAVMMPPAQAAAATTMPPAPAPPPVTAPPAQAGPPVATPPAAQAVPPAGAGTPPPPATPPAVTPYGLPAAPLAVTPAQVTITVPAAEWRVGQGPYTLTLSALNMTRAATVTLTLTYNPAALKLRALQEGSFMRTGVPNTAFAQQADNAAGRIDITISRTGDVIGATGSGTLAAVVFDAVAPGTVNFRVSGTANGPGGSIPLQFTPATVTVK